MTKTFTKAALASLVAVTCLSAPVSAADLYQVGSAEFTVGINAIEAQNNFKYVNYKLAEDTLAITLLYSGSCEVQVDHLLLRKKGFTPKGVTGDMDNVVITPATLDPEDGSYSGNVTFDLWFSTLKTTGKKAKGMAHLDLGLLVDDDCDAGTAPLPYTIGVQVSASTGAKP